MHGDLLAGQRCARTVSSDDDGIFGMCRPIHLAIMPQRTAEMEKESCTIIAEVLNSLD